MAAYDGSFTSALLLLLLLLLSSFLPAPGSALTGYPAVFNFGDSNSDTGGLVAGVAFPVSPPNGETYFHEPSGRFSDGRLIVDFLMDAMDLPFLSPSGLGRRPKLQNGVQLRHGRGHYSPSKCRFQKSVLVWDPGGSILQVQGSSPRVASNSTKNGGVSGNKSLRKYLPKEEYFQEGLYTFDVGQNDLYVAFFSKTEDQVIASIPIILSEFQNGIQRLYNAGARNFWIHNTGPLGCLARVIASNKNESDVDPLGCLASRNRAAVAFNTQLHQLCTTTAAQLFPAGANLTYVDVYAVKLDLIANHSRYGFKEPLAACCGYGGPPLNFDSRVDCGVTKTVDGSTVTANPCDDASEYVNWDGIHYTEAANRFVSQQVLSGNFSDPPPTVSFVAAADKSKLFF